MTMGTTDCGILGNIIFLAPFKLVKITLPIKDTDFEDEIKSLLRHPEYDYQP
jgi:hypothetical protein